MLTTLTRSLFNSSSVSLLLLTASLRQRASFNGEF